MADIVSGLFHRSRRWRAEFDAERLIAILFFLAAIVLVASPILYLLYGSFRSDSPGAPGAEFTLQNWVAVYTTPGYGSALVNTLLLSLVVAAMSVAVGAALAWIVVRTDAPGTRFLAPLLVVPLMISTLVTTLAWIALAAPNAGFINALTQTLFGIRTVINIYSFLGIALVLVLHFASFAFVALYGALRNIDPSVEEAAAISGAGPIKTALVMTLPLILPAIASTFLLIFIFVAENFAVPGLLGSAMRFQTLSTKIYEAMSLEPGRPTLAAAAGTILLWIALMGILLQRQILKRGSRYATIAGKSSHSTTIELGRWRGVATGFLVVYLLLAVVLPYFALILASLMKFVTPRFTRALFTTDNYEKLLNAANAFPATNSLLLAGVGGILATLLYVCVAHFIRRVPGRLGIFVDYIVVLPTATPALVLGVGFVWAFVGLPIYGTLLILLVAFLSRFIGQGVQQANSSLVQISGELSEAAMISGASPLRTFVFVTLPLMRPAIISLWTLLFILIFMEVSMSVLLYTTRTITLPVRLWNLMSGGYQTEAFAVAVLQTTIVFALLYMANRFLGTLNRTLDR